MTHNLSFRYHADITIRVRVRVRVRFRVRVNNTKLLETSISFPYTQQKQRDTRESSVTLWKIKCIPSNYDSRREVIVCFLFVCKCPFIYTWTLILSNFNYCPVIWHYCSEKNSIKIGKIQERALRFIYEDYDYSYEIYFKNPNYHHWRFGE